jgi:hypothetical protein
MNEVDNPEVDLRIDEIRKTLSNMEAKLPEFFKARQEFYVHLTLLNAGTLSLLITAICALAASNHLNTLHIQEGSRLVAGCWMLIFSIIFSLVHNYFNINFLIQTFGYTTFTLLQIDIKRLNYAVSKANGSTFVSLQEYESRASKSQRVAKLAERICMVIGPAAQLITIAAYVEFLLSMRATIFPIVG